MKKLCLAILLTLAGFAATAPSATAQTIGTFCSASTPEGFWAMKFGPVSAAHNCAVVRRQLGIPQSAYADLNHGFYNIYGINRVLITCGFYYQNIITSTGAYALQNAVNTAQFSGLTHCRFAVNGY